jgi:hypothetical protein
MSSPLTGQRGIPPLSVPEVSRRVRGLRLRNAVRELTLSYRAMLPPATQDIVGVLVALPASSPVNASMVALRQHSAKLGVERIVNPFS